MEMCSSREYPYPFHTEGDEHPQRPKKKKKKTKAKYEALWNFACRSQESVTQHHNDKEKPHLHLLSTHFYIRDYKTSFVNRPRQLVATVCF